MDGKIAVPEGMLEAAVKAVKIPASGELLRNQPRDILEAALRWQSENPIVPTKEQLVAMCEVAGMQGTFMDITQAETIALEWQRRMHLAPEPEPEVCPVEKALRDSGVAIRNDWLCPECEKVHEAIIPTRRVSA